MSAATAASASVQEDKKRSQLREQTFSGAPQCGAECESAAEPSTTRRAGKGLSTGLRKRRRGNASVRYVNETQDPHRGLTAKSSYCSLILDGKVPCAWVSID